MSDDIDPAFKSAWRESQGQPVDAEPRTNYIAEAITEAFGERCPDYEPGCHCCEAWKQYDALAASQEPTPVAWTRNDLASGLAMLDGVVLHQVKSTVGDPQDANNWREYLGLADDLLAHLSCVAAPVPPVVGEDRNAGINAAIAFVRKRCDDYIAEHGSYDPETGATEFPGNGDETVCEWEEIIEGLEQLRRSALTPQFLATEDGEFNGNEAGL